MTDWAKRLKTFLPELALRDGTLLLHGSTTAGVDDEWSDLDVWLLPPTETPGKFIEFVCDGKKGHVNIESQRTFEDRVQRCDFALIYELRRSVLLQDDAWGQQLIATASRPMSDAVREAWFAYHYIEMRSEHRACDNPINRGDAIALLLAVQPTLTHAMQAAMVLDGEPYPYSKWLPTAAAKTPTGAKVVPLIEEMIDLLGAGALRQAGPEGTHPINRKLKQIRQTLIDAARAGGLDAPWLSHWYLHLGLRRQIEHVTWE
jgi:hypothetical protein